MDAELENAIARQWADDEEYLETCDAIGMDLGADWEIEARLRSSSRMPDFVVQMLRRDWKLVSVIRIRAGGEEVSLRRCQTLLPQAVKTMSAGLVRLADRYSLDWLNWSEFDGHIHRILRRQLAWTWDPGESGRG